MRKLNQPWEKYIEKIKDNDLNPNVTLYVFPEEDIEEIDVEREWKELRDLEGELGSIEDKIEWYLRGFDAKQFFCLDDYYDSERSAYYRALRSVDQGTLDLTSWLEYFVQGVNVSIAAVKKKVTMLSSERLRRTREGQVALTERQMKIVEEIVQKGRITNRKMREIFGLSDEAVRKEISKLMKLGVIRRQGRGRAVHYVLT